MNTNIFLLLAVFQILMACVSKLILVEQCTAWSSPPFLRKVLEVKFLVLSRYLDCYFFITHFVVHKESEKWVSHKNDLKSIFVFCFVLVCG